ncbi:MAG: DUF4350 domain-containing protein [Anaerolineae bacterium]|nr:DUF4350 domain-containing protein [Anaerolineae bacterium]
MRILSREFWWGLAIAALLLLVTGLSVIQQSSEIAAPALTSDSSQPDGALALYEWLDKIGYNVNAETGNVFNVPANTRVALVLEPSVAISGGEWSVLDRWIKEGGALLLAGEQSGTGLALNHFDVTLRYLGTDALTLTAQTPLWLAPPLTAPVPIQTRRYLSLDRDDCVVHFAAGGKPVIVSFDYGEGKVILSAAPFPFTNAGLKETNNAMLILNMLNTFPQGTLWFDEWHHGKQGAGAIDNPQKWLRRSPTGHALIFTAMVIFVALALQGRRLGRHVPLLRQITPRAPLEYITAIANLRRRAAHRQAELRYYYQALKRHLGRPYGINPQLPDKEFVSALESVIPDMDAAGLLQTLTQLQQPKVSENEMQRLAQKVALWIEE